jgi:hypothetical protein
LAVPAFVVVAVTQGVVLYVASNFLLSPPPANFDTISGENRYLPCHKGETKISPMVVSYVQKPHYSKFVTDDDDPLIFCQMNMPWIRRLPREQEQIDQSSPSRTLALTG